MKTIELIGMEGSGKSYYQEKVLQILKKKKINGAKFKKIEINKIFKLYFYFIFFLKYFYFSISLLNTLIGKEHDNERMKRIHNYWLLNEIVSYINSSFHKKTIVVSEGFYTRSLFYFQKKFKEKKFTKIKKIIKSIPNVNLLIYVKEKKEKCIKNCLKRKSGFLYSSLDKKLFNKKKSNIDFIVNFLKKEKLCEVLVINSKNNRNNLKKIEKKLKIL